MASDSEQVVHTQRLLETELASAIGAHQTTDPLEQINNLDLN